MNSIKNSFSIKDLENLSGIKAHTIRIWEKRYKVLEPDRTQTNIRQYDTSSLQKLLNITLLHHHGYKISKISKFPPEKIPSLVREIITEKSVRNHAISAFKMAMLNFDPAQFHKAYEDLLSEKTFRQIFYEVFIPLINEIGLLWQSDTITPAHEHFISFLIKQKIVNNIEALQKRGPKTNERVFVLYLPENELHELGLMFVNYELLEKGYQTIYLGESIPLGNLPALNRFFDRITFLSYFTVEPVADEIKGYINEICNKVLNEKSDFWILGKQVSLIDTSSLPEKIKTFNSIKAMTDEIDSMTV